MPGVTNKWIDMIHRIKLSTNASVGFRELWVNTGSGYVKQALNGSTNPYFHTTMLPGHAGGTNYIKQSGYRRKGMFARMTHYATPVKVSTTYAEADPGTYTSVPPPDTQAPGTSTLSGSAGDAQVTLNWTAGTDNVAVTAYDVFSGVGVLLRSVSGTTLTTTFTGLANGTPASYYVKARDAAGNSGAASNTVTLTPTAPTDTQAPSVVTVTGTVGNAQVTVNWTAATDNVGVDHYRIEDADGNLRRTVSGSTLTSTFTGLTNGYGYEFIVKAVDAAGNVAAPSNRRDLKPQNNAETVKPTANTLTISDTGNNDGDITLSWTGATDNVGVTSNGIHEVPQKYVRTINMPTKTHTITGLTNGVSKSYIVVALDAAGNIGPWSNQVSGTP